MSIQKVHFIQTARWAGLELLESRLLLVANPFISEFMADNLSTIRDGYDQTPELDRDSK